MGKSEKNGVIADGSWCLWGVLLKNTVWNYHHIRFKETEAEVLPF
jgi:hypothetical protein